MNGKIDNRFAVPPYVSDLSNDDDADYAFMTEDATTTDPPGPEVDVPSSWVYPSSFVVVGQTVRTVNGVEVVDIIIEVDDHPEIKEYDIRIAKV